METDEVKIAERKLAGRCVHCGNPNSKDDTEHNELCPVTLLEVISKLEDRITGLEVGLRSLRFLENHQ